MDGEEKEREEEEREEHGWGKRRRRRKEEAELFICSRLSYPMKNGITRLGYAS